MKRLCFGWHGDTTRYAFPRAFAGAMGVPPSNSIAVGDLRRAFELTHNKGFMVVGEATTRLFACDADAGAVADLRWLTKIAEHPRETAARINDNFDVLVLGMAYELRAGVDYGDVLDILCQVRIPIVTLGLSVISHDASADLMHTSVLKLARYLSEHAVLFGVRAGGTKAWLEQHGITKAVALGCPSLHLYPQMIMGMRPPAISVGRSLFATGGYLLLREERARSLCRLFAGVRANYILQDELFALPDAGLADIPFCDARREYDSAAINDYAAMWMGQRPPFQRYFFFDDMSAWRQSLAWHDVYVGDRFHGAARALQAGIPTAVICKDMRSEELAAFYDLPALTLDDAMRLGLEGIFADILSVTQLGRMKETYHRRSIDLREALAACDLKLNLDC